MPLPGARAFCYTTPHQRHTQDKHHQLGNIGQPGPHSHFLSCLPDTLCGCFFFPTQDAIKHHVWVWLLCLPYTISHDTRSFEASRPDVLQNVPRDSHVSLRPNVSSKGSSRCQPISPRPRGPARCSMKKVSAKPLKHQSMLPLVVNK